jgi:hypothetical protein
VDSPQLVRGDDAVVATVQIPRALVEPEPEVAPAVEAVAVEGAPADAAATAPGAVPAAAGAKKEPEKKEGDKGAKK